MVDFPKRYQKSDGCYYFTFKTKQYYVGSTLDRAQVKLEQIVSIGGTPSQACLVNLVGEYLDSINGTQSPDTVYGKAVAYKRLFADLSKTEPTIEKDGPGLYSLHESSTVTEKHSSYGEAFAKLFPGAIPLTTFTTDNLEKYRRVYLDTAKKLTVKTAFIKIRALSKWLHEKGYLKENPCSKIPALKVAEELDPDHLTEKEVQCLFEVVEKGTAYARVRDKLMFALMIYADLRRIECARIKWTDVDFNKRVIVVRNGTDVVEVIREIG